MSLYPMSLYQDCKQLPTLCREHPKPCSFADNNSCHTAAALPDVRYCCKVARGCTRLRQRDSTSSEHCSSGPQHQITVAPSSYSPQWETVRPVISIWGARLPEVMLLSWHCICCAGIASAALQRFRLRCFTLRPA